MTAPFLAEQAAQSGRAAAEALIERCGRGQSGGGVRAEG
jgi:hypothetical protein